MFRRTVRVAIATLLLWPWGSSMADQNDARLSELFGRLRAPERAAEVGQVENAIWQIWLQAGAPDIDAHMVEGIRALEAGDGTRALAAFNAVIDAAPGFAEGWNKRATLYYLMGEFESSAADIDRTLALEPRHFGALSGLALIREAQGRPFEALEALEKLQYIHPHLPHLGERIDRLTRQLGEPV